MSDNTIKITISGPAMLGKSAVAHIIGQALKEKGIIVNTDVSVQAKSDEAASRIASEMEFSVTLFEEIVLPKVFHGWPREAEGPTTISYS